MFPLSFTKTTFPVIVAVLGWVDESQEAKNKNVANNNASMASIAGLNLYCLGSVVMASSLVRGVGFCFLIGRQLY